MEDLFLIDSQLESRQVNHHTLNDSLSPQYSSHHHQHNHQDHHHHQQQQGPPTDDCESVNNQSTINNQITETQDSVLLKAEEGNTPVASEVEQVDTSELNIKSIKIKVN
ncbi:unnamed protein product [Trichobilharzia regenti]|nr:unnamed protein product [Trichobilharzia regenti]